MPIFSYFYSKILIQCFRFFRVFPPHLKVRFVSFFIKIRKSSFSKRLFQRDAKKGQENLQEKSYRS
jgi:hypothetical protein